MESRTVIFSMGKFTPVYPHGIGHGGDNANIIDENVRESNYPRGSCLCVGTVPDGQPLFFIKNQHQINLDGQIALARDVDGDGKISNGDIKKSTDDLSAMLKKNGVVTGAALANMGYVPMILLLDGGDGRFVIPKLLQGPGMAWAEKGEANLHDVNAGDKLTLESLSSELAEINVEPSGANFAKGTV